MTPVTCRRPRDVTRTQTPSRTGPSGAASTPEGSVCPRQAGVSGYPFITHSRVVVSGGAISGVAAASRDDYWAVPDPHQPGGIDIHIPGIRGHSLTRALQVAGGGQIFVLPSCFCRQQTNRLIFRRFSTPHKNERRIF